MPIKIWLSDRPVAKFLPETVRIVPPAILPVLGDIDVTTTS